MVPTVTWMWVKVCHAAGCNPPRGIIRVTPHFFLGLNPGTGMLLQFNWGRGSWLTKHTLVDTGIHTSKATLSKPLY